MVSQTGDVVHLSKGQSANIVHLGKPVSTFNLALGWMAQTVGDEDFDLDVWAVELRRKRGIDPLHVVFYNNMKDPEGALEHNGDNLVGGDIPGEDIEVITVRPALILPEVDSIDIYVSIYEGAENGQNFGRVRNAFVRTVAGNRELTRYDLTEDSSRATIMRFGRLVRDPQWPVRWSFQALGEPMGVTMGKIMEGYGLEWD